MHPGDPHASDVSEMSEKSGGVAVHPGALPVAQQRSVGALTRGVVDGSG